MGEWAEIHFYKRTYVGSKQLTNQVQAQKMLKVKNAQL